MLLTAVILVLQETLEVALLVSVLIAASHRADHRLTWLPIGLVAGFVLSLGFAANTDIISAWLDYAGLEVVNALLQLLIALALVIFAWSTFTSRQGLATESRPQDSRHVLLYELSALVAIALSITREGSEILLYMSGFFHQENTMTAALMGGSIGFSIGVSLAILIFYALTGLPRRWGLSASLLLLALFAGNMLSQSALQLTQADWLPALQPLWDTSAWISEHSVTGQLLYALIGYEATPSIIQAGSYLAGVLLVGMAAMSARQVKTPPGQVN